MIKLIRPGVAKHPVVVGNSPDPIIIFVSEKILDSLVVCVSLLPHMQVSFLDTIQEVKSNVLPNILTQPVNDVKGALMTTSWFIAQSMMSPSNVIGLSKIIFINYNFK